jgi:hypothetical protein
VVHDACREHDSRQDDRNSIGPFSCASRSRGSTRILPAGHGEYCIGALRASGDRNRPDSVVQAARGAFLMLT